MYRGLKALVALAAFQISLLATGAALAASVAPLTFDQIVAGAKQIVHVRCTGNVVQADPDVGVVTVTSFLVLDSAKGNGGSTFTVRQVGGELNGLAVDYHVPKFSVGGEYVLFMPASSRLGLASPVGLSQGAFSVLPGAAGKEVSNGRDFGDLLAGTDAASVPPGIAARLARGGQARSRMDLDEFMAFSRAKAGTQ
ncbi:MAG TPA: hypothetical protein VMU96_14240 [Casimicrobiaceae bacterium]|nr:hypothetical protein [Casimicrobiaceae bacterium]